MDVVVADHLAVGMPQPIHHHVLGNAPVRACRAETVAETVEAAMSESTVTICCGELISERGNHATNECATHCIWLEPPSPWAVEHVPALTFNLIQRSCEIRVDWK